MSNDLSDINYNIKTLLKTSTTDENDKCIKVIQTQPRTHSMSCGTTVNTASYLILPLGNSFLMNAYVVHGPVQYAFVASSGTGYTFTIRVYFIDANYNEVIEDIAFVSSSNTATSVGTNYLNVNYMELISGSANPSTMITAFPLGVAIAYAEGTIFGNSSAAYNWRFMCPRGKIAKLSSIDYYRNVAGTSHLSNADLSLQIFLRGTASNVSNPLFNYLAVQSPFQKNYGVNGAYTLKYGDSCMFYRTASNTSTACNLNATFTLYDDAEYV